MLTVRLLGRVSIRRDGIESAAFGSGPLLRLLTALTLRAGTPVSRTELAFRLWPDSSEAQARTNLRKALHQLRHELDDVDRFVEITNESVRWSAGSLAQVDVVAFLAACDDGDDGAAAERYGGSLLPGVYDDWVLEERARLHGLATAALRRLIDRAGDDAAARAELAARLVELDPTSEWAHRHVIGAHAARGDRAGAIRAYHRCVEVLASELGVEPGPETQALYEDLVAGSATGGGLPPRPTPLVGRQVEWAALEHRWRQVGEEPLQLVVVTGEAGVGKSRLVAELARHVRSESALVLHARSYESVDAPWAPVAAWLRDEALSTSLAGAPAELLSEVSRLAPELRSRDDVPPPAPITDELARFQFTESLTAALLHGRERRVLVLDDVQWCDAPTLGLVAHLLRSRPSAPAMVVATARRDELADDHPFVGLLDALDGEGRATVLDLGRLSPHDTALVAEAVASRPLDRSDHDRIWAESGGNPLFVVELAKSDRSWAEPEQVVPTLRAAIERRLRRLSSGARRVVELAATFGGEFRFEELIAASGDGPDEIVAALDELWRRQIVTETGARYDVVHDTFREVVLAGLSAARRTQLHAAVADALVAVHGEERASGRAAVHLRAAGRFAEAIEALRRSARASLHLFDLGVAIDTLRGALELVPTLDEPDDPVSTELELLIDLGAALVAREGYGSSEVRDVYGRAMGLARMRGDLVDPAILRGLGLAAVVGCRFDEAERLGRLLTTTIDDQVARTEGHYLLGVISFWRGELAVAADELDASLRAYDPARRELHQTRFAQDPYPVVLVRLAVTRFWTGDEPSATELTDRAVAWCTRTGHRQSTAYVLAYAGMLAAERHDAAALAEVIEQARELWSEAPGFFAAFAPLYEGWCDVLAGDTRAASRIDVALDDWRASGQVLHLTHGLVLRTRAALGDGDLDAAEQALHEARRRTEATGQGYLLAELHRLAGVVAARRSGPDAATRDLERAVETAAASGAAVAELWARATRLALDGTGRAETEALLVRHGDRLPAFVVRDARRALDAPR